MMLGGEHSISYGAVLAMKKVYPDISVLHFDAHADMRDTYQGSPYSHACVARRIHRYLSDRAGGHPQHEYAGGRLS